MVEIEVEVGIEVDVDVEPVPEVDPLTDAGEVDILMIAVAGLNRSLTADEGHSWTVVQPVGPALDAGLWA